MVEAARVRGHELVVIDAKTCKMKFNNDARVLVNNKFPKINVLIVKSAFGGDKIDIHMSLIKQFELMNIPVVNESQAVTNARNKLTTLQILSINKIPTPKTYVVRSSEFVEEVVQKIGSYPVILKSVSGSQGIGVSIIESRRGLRSIVDMLVEQEYSLPVIIQEYVREAKGKDLRVFVVGGKIVAAMERVAQKKDEFRSNFSLGGKVRIANLSTKEKNIALKATKVCGLDFAGVDVIRTKEGPKILEVNANPGLEGITLATGVDVAGHIIDYALTKVKEKPKTKLKKVGKKKRG